MPLDRAFLFQGMSDESRQEVARIAEEEFHEKGAFLFNAGDPAESLFILKEGRVRLSVRGAGHIAHIVSDSGDAIGWSSMAENELYTASAECLVPVRVLKILNAELARILENDPSSGISFYRRLAQLIGRRLVASYGATLSVHGQRDSRSWG